MNTIPGKRYGLKIIIILCIIIIYHPIPQYSRYHDPYIGAISQNDHKMNCKSIGYTKIHHYGYTGNMKKGEDKHDGLLDKINQVSLTIHVSNRWLSKKAQSNARAGWNGCRERIQKKKTRGGKKQTIKEKKRMKQRPPSSGTPKYIIIIIIIEALPRRNLGSFTCKGLIIKSDIQ